MPARTTSVRFAPGPSGTAWRRTSAGWSTTSSSGSSRWYSRSPQVPRSSSVSPNASSVSPGRSSPLRWTARTTRSPLSVTMPGKTVSPIRAERGGTTTSATPIVRLKSVSGSWSRSYCSTSVRASVPKSRVVDAGRAFGQQPLAEEDDDRNRAGEQGQADERELEEAEPPDARLVGELGDDHVDRRAGEREQRARVGAEGERQQQLGGRQPQPDRDHGHDGQQRGDRAVDADQRRQDRDEQHRQHDQPRFGCRPPSRSVAVRPRR